MHCVLQNLVSQIYELLGGRNTKGKGRDRAERQAIARFAREHGLDLNSDATNLNFNCQYFPANSHRNNGLKLPIGKRIQEPRYLLIWAKDHDELILDRSRIRQWNGRRG